MTNSFSQQLHSEGSMEFEPTGNENVDFNLKIVDNMDMEKLNELMYGIADLFTIHSGDCEELKEITSTQIKDGSYLPNIEKTLTIQKLYKSMVKK